MHWPRAKDADLWILIWEELHRVHREGILVEVEHVKAHRTWKEIQQMSLFKKFITESNEKGDAPAKEGAMQDGGDMAQVRVCTIQQEREEVYAALQHAAGFRCLIEDQSQKKSCFSQQKREATKHRTEWCAASNTYRYVRCGRSSKHMKNERQM